MLRTVIVISLCLLLSCNAPITSRHYKLNNYSWNDLKRYQLRGPVKSFKETHYSVFLGDTTVAYNPHFYNFDKNGLRLNYFVFYDSTPTLHTQFKHVIKDGLLLKSYQVDDCNSNFQYRYSNNRLDSLFFYIADDDTSALVECSIYAYDSDSRITEIKQISDTNLTFVHFVRDSLDRLVREEWRGHNPSNRGFNEYGDMIYYARTFDNGLYDSTQYIFTYDSVGNWVSKRSLRLGQQESSFWTIREFVYW